MVTLPLLSLELGLVLASNSIVPFPDPEDGETESHELFDVALQSKFETNPTS